MSIMSHLLVSPLIGGEATLFWSGPKRCPVIVRFDPDNSLHVDYVIAAANLRAENFAVTERVRNFAELAHYLDTYPINDWKPSTNVRVCLMIC